MLFLKRFIYLDETMYAHEQELKGGEGKGWREKEREKQTTC